MSDQFILDEGNQFLFLDAEQADVQTVFSSPELNTFLKITITMKRISDGSTTDISFCNRELLPELDMWPLLKRVDNIGSRNNEYMPEISRSAVVIMNTSHSFGVERKFSDLFDRYTLIEAPVKIYIAQIPLGKESIAEIDFVEKWRTVITDVDVSSNDIRLGMTRALIPVGVCTKMVDRVSFPNAPAESLGKALPVIFSQEDEFIEIQPVRTSEFYDTGAGASIVNNIDYAYATTFSNKFIPSGSGSDAIKIYVDNQDRDRTYEEVVFVSDPLVPLLQFPPLSTSFKNAWGTVKEYGYGLLAGQNVTGGEIIIGVNWYLAATVYSNVPLAGTYSYTVKVYNAQNGFPGTVLASDTLKNGDFRITYHGDTAGGDAMWKFEFRLNKAIQIPLIGSSPANSSIFITLSRNDPSNAFSLLQEGTAPGSLPAFEKYIITDTTAGTDQNFTRNVVTNARDHFSVFALAKTDDLTGGSSSAYQKGLGHVGFTIKMRDQDNYPDITKLRFIAKSQGMKDDSFGTISGVANYRLDIPLYQIRMLLMEWNGSAWVENVFDASKFSNTHTAAFGNAGRWKIKTAGATQGRIKIRDLIEDICRNGGCRLISYVSGTSKALGLYAHGTKLTDSFIVDDERAKLVSFEIAGVDSILNKIQIAFDRSIQARVESLLAEGGLNNYNQLIDSSVSSLNLDVPYDLIAKSISLYGDRVLDSISYPFITKEQTAKSIMALLLRRWNMPPMTIKVEVPYSYYPDLEVTSVGSLKMVGLPDYFGTTQEANLPTNAAGTDVLDVNKGHYFKRYRTYRVQLENNDILFSDTVALKRLLTFRVVEERDIV